MSTGDVTEEKQETTPEETAPESTRVELAYAGPSKVVATEGAAELMLYGNLRRPPVHLEGSIKEPLRFREAMSALYAIVGSDLRCRDAHITGPADGPALNRGRPARLP